MSNLSNRYEFKLFFDVIDGNPNGDPDAGNLPRVDAETGFGLVSDVCLKRKIRNYVELTRQGEPGYEIFIQERAILNQRIDAAYETEEVKSAEDKDKVETARQQMCKRYYDIRSFGAVLTTGKNAGQVRGPLQMTFARSLAPIVSLEHSITRMAVTTEKESEEQKGGNRTMARKFTVPYGLYATHGFISPQLAANTGFNQNDLELFFNALINMFEYDRSAARGLMATRRLIVFKHDSALGNAPAWKLFNLVKCRQIDEGKAPRRFQDFEISIDQDNCPASVEIIEMV